MSLKLREFIKKIRACKTLEEERCLVNKESAEIRNLSKDHAEKYATRSLSKCIAMSLLGYPTEFIHMTCLGLLANSKFTQKRLAYLGICILLDEKSEVLLLTSHTIKKDLTNENNFIIAAALNAIGEIGTPDMCRETCSEVVKCLSSNSPYIKKKAALALSKIVRSCPELIETVASKLKLIFEDKNHGVLISGLSLVITIFKLEPSYIKKNIKFVPNMLKYLKNLSTTNYSPEYDINGVTDPFLQAKILEVLAYFGRIYDDESEEMANLLGTLPTNTETGTKNTGNAVLYELVRTIFAYDSSSGLRTLASTILGKFLANKDNNYKYIAMNSLQDIARIDIASVQKHKNVILDFLNDSDIAIKRKSLDLTYQIVNENNIKQIIKESLNFLSITDNNEFKLEITQKIFQSLEKYSPSLKWEIDILLKMLCLCENHINEEILHKIINLILSSTELHRYAMFRFFVAMKSNINQEGLIKVGVYLLGELSSLIIGATAKVEEEETVTITEENIVDLITELVNNKETSEHVHEELMNCCFKLLSRLSAGNVAKIKALMEQETKSFFCEVQERANEYIVFTQIANEDMQRKITENIPINKNISDEGCKKTLIVDEYENENEKDICANLIGGGIESFKNTSTSQQQIGEPQIPSINPSQQQQQQQQQQQKPHDIFDEIGGIFGASTSTNTNTNNNVPSQPTQNPPTNDPNNIFNLFDMTSMMGNQNQAQQSNPIPQVVPQTAPQTQQPQENKTNDLFAQLGSIYSQPQSQPQVQPQVQMQPQPQGQPGAMKEVYKNALFSVYSMLNQSGSSYSGAFYISNNTPKRLTNVKLNFLVKKHITFKVISTSGNVLEPNASLGIKKEISMQNNDVTKPIVIKMNLAYTVEGKDVTESAMINNI